mgnify:CR=1 FL=1
MIGDKKKSFTLAEMIIVIIILGMIVGMVYKVFRDNIILKEKLSISSDLRENLVYLIEKISREVRMAKSIDEKNNEDTDLLFTNQEGEKIKYCLSDITANCTSSGKYLARCNLDEGTCHLFSPEDIEITSLFFKINNFCLPGEGCSSYYQPYITFFIKAQKKKKEFFLQTTITPRIYVVSP